MRSKLFVPAIKPELFPKAMQSPADAICFDLEDSVPPSRKSEARNHVNGFLRSYVPTAQKQLLVRVNAVNSPDFSLDIRSVVQHGLSAVALPKVESVEEIQYAVKLLCELEQEREIQHPIALLVTVESPRGLRRAAELASSSPRILGLQLGFADLCEPLGISADQRAARQQIRLLLRLAAGEAALDCYEAAYPFVRNQDGFLSELEDARALGFAGASCIHPGQIEIANRVFAPTDQEVTDAETVLAAASEAERNGQSVVLVNGKMIDAPFLLRAQAILKRRHEHGSV